MSVRISLNILIHMCDMGDMGDMGDIGDIGDPSSYTPTQLP